MCSSGGSSAPQNTPLPKQEAGNPTNGITAINNAPAAPTNTAPTNTTVDTNTTDTQTDRGTSSLRIRRSRGSSTGSAAGTGGTGLNIPT